MRWAKKTLSLRPLPQITPQVKVISSSFFNGLKFFMIILQQVEQMLVLWNMSEMPVLVMETLVLQALKSLYWDLPHGVSSMEKKH